MKRCSLFLFFFFISIAAIVLNEGGVDAARLLKSMNIVTAEADKNHNLVNGDHEIWGGIFKHKLPSGPTGGGGHRNINSLGSEKMKAGNTLKINKLPSGPSGGAGHKYINAAGSMKAASTVERITIDDEVQNKPITSQLKR